MVSAIIIGIGIWGCGFIVGYFRGNLKGYEAARANVKDMYIKLGVDAGRLGYKYLENDTYEIDERFIEQMQLGEMALKVRAHLDSQPSKKADITAEVLH